MERHINLENLAWFWDIYERGLLELTPPYQRRSIWNQRYKDYFIDTVLNELPCPPIFLYREVTPEGGSRFAVIDGKQRLSTLFEFARNEFPVSDDCTIASLKGKYFKDFTDRTKEKFWEYKFIVEYIPDVNEKNIEDIFDRINRNVAKLTRQELRHAKLDGTFITKATELAQELHPGFPRIIVSQKMRMKDVEFAAELFLLVEKGPRSYSSDDLDDAFVERDQDWEKEKDVLKRFNQTKTFVDELIKTEYGKTILRSRLRNIANFYSLFGALDKLLKNKRIPKAKTAAKRLLMFVKALENEELRKRYKILDSYYEAARSASNDAGPRKKRIEILTKVIKGQFKIG